MALKLNLIRNFIWKISDIFIHTLIGCLVLFIIFTLVLLLAPTLLYRWILTKYIAPKYRPAIGKAINASGHFLATEFAQSDKTSKQSSSLKSPRCAIVCTATFSGTTSPEEITEILTEGWLTVKEGESELRYPEFKQYIDKWMGFMFWKPDTDFSLENHLHIHKIPERANKEDSEKIVCNLVETLLNKPFPPKRSPWEVHLVFNYRNPNLIGDASQTDNQWDRELHTLILFRFHHAMVDGFSIMFAIFEGLLGQKLPTIDIANPNKVKKSGKCDCCAPSVFRKMVYVPLRILYDMGFGARLQWQNRGGKASFPWRVPDENKKWKQLYSRSKLIPVQKIKFIKTQLNVSFTGVLLSSLAAGTAENFKKRCFKGRNKIPIGTIVPLPGHPNKLRNHAVATVLELNVSQNLDPVERLKSVEKDFIDARHFSQVPFLMWMVGRMQSSSLVPISRFLSRNRVLPAGLSNFPGPGIQMRFRGKTCLAMDACAGGLDGVVGVAFTVISYHDHVRVAVVTEKGVMGREELAELIESIENEIDVLYARAQGIKEASQEKTIVKVMGDEMV